MDELFHFVAGLTGVSAARYDSVGPVNLTIMNEGARRGFRWAGHDQARCHLHGGDLLLYRFTGFASLFSQGYVKAAMEVQFRVPPALGIKFLLAKSVQAPVHLSNAADRIEAY
jgi:hypothetical protein